MMKYLIMAVIIANVVSAQDSSRFYKENSVNLPGVFIPEKLTKNMFTEKKSSERKTGERIGRIEFMAHQTDEREYSFDLMSSVGSNMNFGGFWENYAVINFTPNVYVKPLSFISFYANHNVNCLIPFNAIGEYSRVLAIQSLSILAVDNSMKMLFPSDKWIPQLISFAAKNLLINFIIKPSIESSINSSAPVLEYDYYYYSVSVSF